MQAEARFPNLLLGFFLIEGVWGRQCLSPAGFSPACCCKSPGIHAEAADERGNPGSFITCVPGYQLTAGSCSLEAQPKWMRVP